MHSRSANTPQNFSNNPINTDWQYLYFLFMDRYIHVLIIFNYVYNKFKLKFWNFDYNEFH